MSLNRQRVNFQSGVANGVINNTGQVTITGAGSWPVPSGGCYIPVVLNPGYFGSPANPEIFYIYSVTSVGGTNNVASGVRQQEGSNLLGSSSGTSYPWVVAPLLNDFGMTNMVANGDVPGGSIPAGAVGYTTVSTQTGSYVVASGDANNLITMNNSSAATLTLTGTSFYQGQQITVYRSNTGTVTITGSSGVSIVSTGANTASPILRSQYSVATAIYLNNGSGAGAWLVTGDIS